MDREQTANGSSMGLSIVHISPGPCISIADGGSMIQLAWPMKKEAGGGATVKRGIIQEFSRKSRQRMQRALAMLDQEAMGLPLFLTLTYPEEYSQEPSVWKRNLDNLRKAIARRWPESGGFWRLEFQKRGAPHFHLLLWRGPDLECIQVEYTGRLIWKGLGPELSEKNRVVYEWLSESWYRIVGSGDPKHLAAGTRLEPIQSPQGVAFYLTKYLCKLPEGSVTPLAWVGRHWGVINARNIKKHPLIQQGLPERVYYRVRRILRKCLERKVGRKFTTWKRQGITVYGDTVKVKRLVETFLSEWYHCPF